MTPALTILYVDDDPDIRTILSLALGRDPEIRAFGAASEAEELAILEGGLEPDGILLDVMIAETDGIDLYAALRKIPALERTPVIFLTARAREQDIETYRALGAVDTIAKPFDPVRLAALVRRKIA